MEQVLRVNGKDRLFGEDEMPGTVLELIERLKIQQATVVAEIDGKIIERNRFGTMQVSPGQEINLIRFVSGG